MLFATRGPTSGLTARLPGVSAAPLVRRLLKNLIVPLPVRVVLAAGPSTLAAARGACFISPARLAISPAAPSAFAGPETRANGSVKISAASPPSVLFHPPVFLPSNP